MEFWNGEEDFSHEKVIFDTSGEIFKKTFDQFGNSVWVTLDFNKGKPTWLYNDSNYVMTCGGPTIGSPCLDLYSIWFNTTAMKNENGGTNYCMHIFSGSTDDPEYTYYWWFSKMTQNTSIDFSYLKSNHLSDTMKKIYNSADNMSEIPYMNPLNYDYSKAHHHNEVETRMDPFDFNFYTKEEFIKYYNSTLQWDFQSPDKILMRQHITNIIYFTNYLGENQMNYLLDKLIDTF